MLQLIELTFSSISSFTSTALLSRYSFTLLRPDNMPSLIGLTVCAYFLSFAKCNNECASTVAVVVPSPASLTVFLAASFIRVAPMFSTGSYKTTDSATVTPSFVITGLPNASSYITHFPEAPRVDFTALVSLSTPCIIFSLASIPKDRSLTISLG